MAELQVPRNGLLLTGSAGTIVKLRRVAATFDAAPSVTVDDDSTVALVIPHDDLSLPWEARLEVADVATACAIR